MTDPTTAQGTNSLAIARRFLTFFEARGHTVVPSSSLVPAGDPTLLFTNSGMVQFKDLFLGRERRSYLRAATLQRCMRVSGKHNDLETVGPSPRHHTFFYMLGNFSFGDYFKREAIPWAWEFVTRDLAIAPDRLIVTVLDDDDESYEHWRALGLPAERILRMGEKTNFWAMGATGPCGPNSELHYDWGPEYCTCGRAEDCSVALDNDCGRWLEIWNLVFMQFDQDADGTRTPLPSPGVDTGMGLERIASVVQQVPTVYDTDLFAPILDRIQSLLGHNEDQRKAAIVPYRVIADHCRAAVFLIADGVTPGNEGRAYVLRMILRRAIRFGRRAGFVRPFMSDVARSAIDLMAREHAELEQRREFIVQAIEAEEVRFSETLTVGLDRMAELIDATRLAGRTEIAGKDVFDLSATYGFPVEMTRDIAREAGLTIDEEGFRREMEAHRERSRVAAVVTFKFSVSAAEQLIKGTPETHFVGYTRETAPTTVLAILKGNTRINEATAGDDVVVILDRTPFYAEAGGQVGDAGTITARGLRVEIKDAQRIGPRVIGHIGRIARGRIRTGLRVRALVDRNRRTAIKRNHTATHLLHRALREVLGEHARQRGSLVAPDRLRFDFTHLAPLSLEERAAVERRVNELILADRPVKASVMPLEKAQRLGAIALFGEKYGEQVRVVEVRGYSRELCGGTHLSATGQIGLFTITTEGSVAAGVRRIEALTGWPAYERVRANERLIEDVAAEVRASPTEVLERVHRLAEQVRVVGHGQKRRELTETLTVTMPVSATVEDVHVKTGRVDDADHENLRTAGDRLREEIGRGVIVLGGVANDRVNLVAMVTPDLHARGLRADALLRAVAARVGGTAGGKPDLAQGGGKDVDRLNEALAAVPEDVRHLVKRA